MLFKKKRIDRSLEKLRNYPNLIKKNFFIKKKIQTEFEFEPSLKILKLKAEQN